MLGLILKDFYSVKRYARTLFVFFILYGIVFGLMADDVSILSGMLVMIFTIMVLTTFSYDEYAKWDRYCLSFPLRRKEVVLAKYLTGVIFNLIGCLFALIANFMFSFFHSSADISLQDSFTVVYLLFGMGLFFLSILLPAVYKFGIEKGRIVIFIACFAPVIFMYCAQNLFGDVSFQISEATATVLMYLFPVFGLVLFALSYLLSTSIYSRKEI